MATEQTAQVMASLYRAARALSGLTQGELATKAGLTANTIFRLENGDPLRLENRLKVLRALEAAGVELITENGEAIGVRFMPKKPKKRRRILAATRSYRAFPSARKPVRGQAKADLPDGAR